VRDSPRWGQSIYRRSLAEAQRYRQNQANRASGDRIGAVMTDPENIPDGENDSAKRSLTDDEIKQQITADLVKLREGVEQETGRQSRWSGEVEIGVGDNKAQAVFRSNGNIGVLPELIYRKARWRTLIHELVHSLGEPVDQNEYSRLMGWEEGPVEIVQRAIRQAVMRDHKSAYDEAHIQRVEVQCICRGYQNDLRCGRCRPTSPLIRFTFFASRTTFFHYYPAL
jgi:hypothetical protein